MSKAGQVTTEHAYDNMSITARLMKTPDTAAVEAFAREPSVLQAPNLTALVNRFRDLPTPTASGSPRSTRAVSEAGGSKRSSAPSSAMRTITVC